MGILGNKIHFVPEQKNRYGIHTRRLRLNDHPVRHTRSVSLAGRPDRVVLAVGAIPAAGDSRVPVFRVAEVDFRSVPVGHSIPAWSVGPGAGSILDNTDEGPLAIKVYAEHDRGYPPTTPGRAVIKTG